MILLLLFLPSVFGQCGSPRCGYARPYYQQPQVYQSPYVQPQVAVPRPLPQAPDPRLYYNGGYVQPPQIVDPIDKDLSTPVPEIEYEKYEKELNKLKPITLLPEESIVPGNSTGITYIRELNYAPQPYLPRPLPYRPHPLLPKGCPVLPPQYVQPIPYMPRGYVQPAPVPVPPPVSIPQPVPPAPVYQTGYVRQFPLNDCCGRCRSPCQFRQRAQARASKTIEKDFVPLRDAVEVAKDSRCTNEQLREIMNKSTTRTPALSKRIIQKVAEEQIGVICSREDFSYVARSEIFCQTEKNDIICYAFQHN